VSDARVDPPIERARLPAQRDGLRRAGASSLRPPPRRGSTLSVALPPLLPAATAATRINPRAQLQTDELHRNPTRAAPSDARSSKQGQLERTQSRSLHLTAASEPHSTRPDTRRALTATKVARLIEELIGYWVLLRDADRDLRRPPDPAPSGGRETQAADALEQLAIARQRFFGLSPHLLALWTRVRWAIRTVSARAAAAAPSRSRHSRRLKSTRTEGRTARQEYRRRPQTSRPPTAPGSMHPPTIALTPSPNPVITAGRLESETCSVSTENLVDVAARANHAWYGCVTRASNQPSGPSLSTRSIPRLVHTRAKWLTSDSGGPHRIKARLPEGRRSPEVAPRCIWTRNNAIARPTTPSSSFAPSPSPALLRDVLSSHRASLKKIGRPDGRPILTRAAERPHLRVVQDYKWSLGGAFLQRRQLSSIPYRSHLSALSRTCVSNQITNKPQRLGGESPMDR